MLIYVAASLGETGMDIKVRNQSNKKECRVLVMDISVSGTDPEKDAILKEKSNI